MGIVGSATKSILDGAKLKISTSGSDGSVLVYAAQVEIDYVATNNTYDESGSGGTTAGTSTLIRFIYKPSSNGGSLVNGSHFFTTNIIPDIVISFSLDVIYNMSTGMSKVMVREI